MATTIQTVAGPANVPSGTSTLLTVPASTTYLVRSVRVTNQTAAKVTVKIGIGGVTDALLILSSKGIPAKGDLDPPYFFALTAGETLQINADATGTTATVTALVIT